MISHSTRSEDMGSEPTPAKLSWPFGMREQISTTSLQDGLSLDNLQKSGLGSSDSEAFVLAQIQPSFSSIHCNRFYFDLI